MLAELFGDLAECGSAAGLHDDADAVPRADDGTHERARAEIEWRVGLRRRVDILVRRRRLAREHALVALELVRLEQSEIRRHDVADAEADDVARDERGHVDRAILAVAQHDRRVPQLRVQSRDSARRAVLAHEPEAHAEPADQEDDQRVGAFAEEHGRDGGHEQQNQERTAQLAHEDRDGSHAVAAERVRADAREPARRFRAREPIGVRVEAAQHLAGRQRGRRGKIQLLRRRALCFNGLRHAGGQPIPPRVAVP